MSKDVQTFERADARPTPVVALLFAVVLSMAQAKTPEPLAEARRAYNEQRYDAAVTLATEALRTPASAPAASVIGARAHLERYRAAGDLADLDLARDALKRVTLSALSARDQVEFAVGLGESLYLDDRYAFDDRYSAAAEQFEIAIGRADLLDEPSRDLLFEWWATSLDRQAQLGPEQDRKLAYERIVSRAERELARSLTAASATYWLAAGARGLEDLPRAWGAAVAGWARGGAMGPRGAALRDDLDRLVVSVILPERAKQFGASNARQALQSLVVQWEQVKDRWR